MKDETKSFVEGDLPLADSGDGKDGHCRSPAKALMDRALRILDASDEPLAAVHLEQAIHSIRRG